MAGQSLANIFRMVMFVIIFIVLLNLISADGYSQANKYMDISMGDGHALALGSDGTVWAWGAHYAGQCGVEFNNPNNIIITPVKVGKLDDVKDIAAGRGFSLALKNDGTVWAWGNNRFGTLGDSRKSTQSPDNRYFEPSIIPGLTNIIAIDASEDYAMALKDDGTVWAWGNNGFCQLGSNAAADGNLDDFISDPHLVTGLSNVEAIACGPMNAIAITEDGTVWLWGRRAYILGERFLSINTLGTPTPGIISSIDSAISAAAGETHAIILKNDGTVWASGDNFRGKLGNGSENYQTISGEFTFVPVEVPGLDDVIAIDAGIEHSIALLANGSVVAWGGNEMGQIGDGTKKDRNRPFLLPLKNAVKISAAGLDTMVLDASGNIWISGDNTWGQVGNAAYTDQQITRYPAYVTAPVMADFSAYSWPTVVQNVNINDSMPTPFPNPNTQPTLAIDASIGNHSSPTTFQNDYGNLNPLMFVTISIVIVFIAIFAYWAFKR